MSKTLFSQWLPAIVKTPTRKVALAGAGLAVAGGALAGPALAIGPDAHAAPAAGPTAAATTTGTSAAKPAVPAHVPPVAQPAKPATTTEPAKPANTAEPAKQVPSAKELGYDYQAQSTFYYCGPAATRIAASTQGHHLSQDEVASELGTTVNGTPSAEDTTRVLNSITGRNAYHTTSIPDPTASQAQVDRLQADAMRALNDGRGVVANIKGTATDVTGTDHAYDGGHYLTVVGYHDQGRTVQIADPADVNGDDSYWMTTSNLANWMTTRGYSS